MRPDPVVIEPPTTRLGLLQRGRGDGFWSVLRDGAAAHDDLLRCVLEDPRLDREVETRARFYAELLVASELPLAPLLAGLRRHDEPQLGHEVLAAAWRLGHAPAREVLADELTADPVVAGITECLWADGWATRVELPPRAAALWLRFDLRHADSAQAVVTARVPSELASVPLEELLELARGPQSVRRDRLLGELCARGDEVVRRHLAAVVTGDTVYERVRLAARALGLLGDERLLPLAEDHFAREDVFEDASRRLSGAARMRRACLADYVQHLPPPVALALARGYHGRGGYFTHVAGCLFQAHATGADREALEAFVQARRQDDGGTDVICELDALGRLGDPRSAPLLVDVAREAAYSHARRRAVGALAAMPELPLAAAVLREALWDCEDESAAAACSFLPQLDAAAQDRVAGLATSPLAAFELTERAQRRLQRGGAIAGDGNDNDGTARSHGHPRPDALS